MRGGRYFSWAGKTATQENIEMASEIAIETLLDEHEVARVTGLSVASVRRWRLLRQGPKYLKLGAAVRYKPKDVTAWIESRPSGGGDEEASTAK
jgi:predicted DNA-binding transcriptional regulator AlpA